MPPSRKGAPKQWRWARALRPGVTALREFVKAGGDLSSVKPVGRALREFDLDPKNLVDWQILAGLLAFHLFAKDSGRRRVWTTERQLELLAQVHDRRQRNAHLSDAAVCQVIARDSRSPDYFRAKGKGEGLRKHLRNARRKYSRNRLARALYSRAFFEGSGT